MSEKKVFIEIQSGEIFQVDEAPPGDWKELAAMSQKDWLTVVENLNRLLQKNVDLGLELHLENEYLKKQLYALREGVPFQDSDG